MKIPISVALFALFVFFANCSITKAQQFHPHLSTALAASHQTKKPVIAVFSANWCAPCKKMLKEVYPSQKIAPFHDKFIWAYLDVDHAVNQHIMTELKVSSVPQLAFIGTDGLPIAQIAGYKSPDELSTILAVVQQQHTTKQTEAIVAENTNQNKLIRTPQITKPTKQIISGLLKKKNKDPQSN